MIGYFDRCMICDRSGNAVRLDGMKDVAKYKGEPPYSLMQIADTVLSYRPKSKQPKPRKRKKAKVKRA